MYRRYHCDYGHEWTVATHEGEPEFAQDVQCPEGHEAVTCNEEVPADEVQIVLRPAARIVDRVTGQVWYAGRYYVVLLDRADQELCASRKHYTWEEATKLAEMFKGKDESRALDLWRRKAP
ncbi:MAG: hypothetical protein D6705_13455 [Deltaproteobacteria bacterium]|nr:MAG: hypothetical protein D6705_13455 [Deltaproteobacteria bacterium]